MVLYNTYIQAYINKECKVLFRINIENNVSKSCGHKIKYNENTLKATHNNDTISKTIATQYKESPKNNVNTTSKYNTEVIKVQYLTSCK